MKTTRFRTGTILQRATRSSRPSASPPRPELLPARMRGPTAQAKLAAGPVPQATRNTQSARVRPPAARRPVIQRMEWFAKTVGLKELKLAPDKLLEVSSSVGNELCHGVCTQHEDSQSVELKSFGVNNAYNLPWRNGDFTQATITLQPSVKYFFTAPLSGCSIWCKYLNKTQIVIRHEARTTMLAHNIHLAQSFGLVFDSNNPTLWGFGDTKLRVDQTDQVIHKYAVHFLLYAALEPDGVTFYVQEQHTRASTDTDTDLTTQQRELARERAFHVPVPS